MTFDWQGFLKYDLNTKVIKKIYRWIVFEQD